MLLLVLLDRFHVGEMKASVVLQSGRLRDPMTAESTRNEKAKATEVPRGVAVSNIHIWKATSYRPL